MLTERQTEIDTILSLQLLVAWAGEESQPARLGWWKSDLVDEHGGGYLFRQLAPRTHRWAALQAVRRVALLADRKARQGMADPDAVQTLFFWGFETDERLEDRLHELKCAQADPGEALKAPFPLDKFERSRFEDYLHNLGPEVPFTTQLSGRELKLSRPADPGQAARHLARALVPLPEAYPAPFFRSPA